MRPRLKVGLLLLAGALMAACGHGSPTSPGTVEKRTEEPLHANGTDVQAVEIPGASKPMELWVVNLDPPIGSDLAVGGYLRLSWTCRGPAGYIAFIRQEVLYEGKAELGSGGSGGSSMLLGDKCEGTGTVNIEVTKDTPSILGYRWYVWAQAGKTWSGPIPSAQPLAVFTQPLNMRRK